MFSFTSLKYKLLFALIFPVVFLWGGFNIYSYYSSQDMLKEQIIQTLENAVESDSQKIAIKLAEKEEAVSIIANVMGDESISRETELSMLKHIKATSSDIKSAYTGYASMVSADSQGVTEKEKPAGYNPTTRAWYKAAVAADGIAYTPVYEETKTKSLVTGIVKKIQRNGSVAGVAGITIDVALIRDVAEAVKIGETGYAAVFDANGKVIYYPNAKVGDDMANLSGGQLAAHIPDITSGQKKTISASIDEKACFVSTAPVGTTGWVFVTIVPEAELLQPVTNLGKVFTISCLLGIAILCGLIIFLTNRIAGRLIRLNMMADKVAQGDLRNTDGIADLNKKGDEIDKVTVAFQQMGLHMGSVIRRIKEVSHQVSIGADSVSNSGNSLAQGATTQASSIEEISTSIAEITAQTNKNALNAKKANEITYNAKEQAHSGNKKMQEMLQAMAAINDSSQNISKIIKVIDEIAFQTNILALNAAVEAARAGQHGKGFAVVSEEVRNLAARSAKAAKETTDIIEISIQKVNNGSQLAQETADALNTIDSGINDVSLLISDIAAESQKQSMALDMLNQGVAQVSKVVQSNSATAEESATASSELSRQAQHLEEAINKFQV